MNTDPEKEPVDLSAVQIFDFKENPVRIFMTESQPWFVASDVCRVLELSNASMACKPLDEDEKGISTAYTLGGQQGLLSVSESGLYALIFQSRKPQAKAFRKWVTSEVLPSLRQKGYYEQGTRRTVRDELADVRLMLVTSMAEVKAKQLDIGRAQQVANLASKYLETLKQEGDAVGYEKLLNMRAGEASQRVLPAS